MGLLFKPLVAAERQESSHAPAFGSSYASLCSTFLKYEVVHFLHNRAATKRCTDFSRSRLLKSVRAREWWVYAKPPFGGPAQVLSYLGRYTHPCGDFEPSAPVVEARQGYV